ncbi:MAG TPA: hypothetical protein PK413_14575, partial [Thermoanaerobaculia bacterium]|nr:hypothetical protein [Thermoanaerobaculia bacterium]
EFLTGLADTSAVPKFQDAWLAGGSLQADGSARIDFHHAFAHRSPFIGQDFDFTPFYMDDPEDVAEQIRHDLEHGRIADLFLVLRVPAGPFPGPSGQPPLIGLDGGPGNDVPIRGNSFVSHDGVVFTPSTAYNFLFQLVLSEDPH